eukprot:4963938-Pyramimonas_sp.AAC.1
MNSRSEGVNSRKKSPARRRPGPAEVGPWGGHHRWGARSVGAVAAMRWAAERGAYWGAAIGPL